MSYAPNSRQAEAPPSKVPAILLRAVVAMVLFSLAWRGARCSTVAAGGHPG